MVYESPRCLLLLRPQTLGDPREEGPRTIHLALEAGWREEIPHTRKDQETTEIKPTAQFCTRVFLIVQLRTVHGVAFFFCQRILITRAIDFQATTARKELFFCPIRKKCSQYLPFWDRDRDRDRENAFFYWLWWWWRQLFLFSEHGTAALVCWANKASERAAVNIWAVQGSLGRWQLAVSRFYVTDTAWPGVAPCNQPPPPSHPTTRPQGRGGGGGKGGGRKSSSTPC